MTDETNAGFWEQGPSGPGDVVGGRYRLPHPLTGEDTSWTRVTNFNKTYADSYGLDRWKLYQLLIGLSRRPDLVAQVRVLDPEDRREMSAITDTALAAADTEKAANEGKAVHRALALADLGQPYPEELEPYVASYRRELARCGLAVVPGMVEVTVCNLDLGVVGTGDRFLVDRAGRVLLGDLKSGRLDRAELEHRIQFACYGTATHYRLGDGPWQPMPTGEQAVRDDVAVLIKIDLEQQSCSVYQVDLVAGRRSANLARMVREDRKLKGTLLPYVPPPLDEAPSSGFAVGADRVEPVPAEGTIREVDGITQVYQLGEWMDLPPSQQNGQARHLAVVPPLGQQVAADANSPFTESGLPQHGQVVGGVPVGEVRYRDDSVAVQWNGQVWVPTDLRPPVPVIPSPTVPPPGRTCPTCGGIPQTRAQLKKLDKAALQALCKNHAITANLAKNKDPLVDYLRDVGHVEGEEPAGRRLDTAPDPSDPQAVAGPIGGVDPTDPRSPAFVEMFLRRIDLAATVADLGRVHAEVTRLGGQQAWTPAIDAAAKARAAAIEAATDGPAYRAAIGREQEPASVSAIAGPLELVAKAETQEALGSIWSTVTLGGTQPERWTDEVGRAAQARLAEIQSRPPAAAVNPFTHTPGVTQ